VNDYYTSRKWQLMVGFDLAVRLVRGIAVARYGEQLAEIVLVGARREYELLIPQLPYIGGRRNPLTQIMISAGMFLALYRAMKFQGKEVEEIGAFVYEGVEKAYGLPPRFALYVYGGLSFSEYGQRRAHELALESQKQRYVNDWVYSVVEGDERSFDYGLDFVECGICKFFHTQGADEFVRHMCRLDFIVSERMGTGLVRTTTIAEEGEKCDFRYKRTVLVR
jgi:hypothetical protein